MTFSVVPSDVAGFAARLSDLGTQVSIAESYVSDHLDVGAGQTGIFVNVAQLVSEVRAELEQNYTRLAELTSSAAAELDRAAVMYGSTDTAAASRLDDSYRPPGEGVRVTSTTR